MTDRYGESDRFILDQEIYKPLSEAAVQKKNVSKKDSIFMYFTVFSVGLLLLSVGCTGVWISPVIKKLKSTDPDINPLGSPLKTYELSILAGLMPVGSLLGPLLLWKLLEKHGRKPTCIYTSILIIAGFLIVAFSKHIYLYYLARVMFGFAAGCSLGTAAIYITEISEDHNRGKFGTLIGLFIPLGTLYGYSIGPFLSICMFSLLCTLPVFFNLILMGLFVPESPFFLATSGKKHKTLQALQKFRNKSPSGLETDFKEIEIILNESRCQDDFLTVFQNKAFRKGLFISIVINVSQIMSGFLVLMSFMGPIFDGADIGLSGDIVAVIVVCVQIIFSLVASIIIEKVGRRILLLTSELGCATALFLVGTFFHLKSIDYIYLNNFTWLPIIGILVYFISFAIGVGPIPMLLISELFQSHTRSIVVSLNMFIISATSIVVTTSFPIAEETIGIASCFWFFAGCCLVAFFFVYTLLPETKGKNIIEIQKMLSK